MWIHGAPASTKARGDRHRVVAVDALAVEVALRELHDLPAAQVDGGEQQHQPAAARSTKLASTARPVRDDFSGWNCVAHTLADATAATTGPP